MIILYPLTAIGQTGATGPAGADGSDGADGDTFPTGTVLFFLATTAPTGWVRLNGGTIGSASSGATERADADTADLYTLLWNNYANAQCAVSGGRGASAAADFAANKTLALPDARGRAPVAYKSGGTFGTLGGTLGAETHTLTEAQLPVVAGHTHDMTHQHDIPASDSSGGATSDVMQNASSNGSDATLSTSSYAGNTGSGGGFGSGQAHNNIQPSIVLGCLMAKL